MIEDDWVEDFYEQFASKEVAIKMFYELVGSMPDQYKNPRVVLILESIPAPEGTSWATDE
jgi:hypothetical protein